MVLITLVTNISEWENSLPFRSFLNQFIFKAFMCSYRSSQKKEAAVSWLQVARGFHLLHALIYNWTFLKVIFFLLLSFIKVDGSTVVPWKNFICSLNNIKQGDEIIKHWTFYSQPRPPRDITSPLGWKNWGPMRLSLSVKFCNLWIGQNIWKQKGMELTFMVEIILILQVFSVIKLLPITLT